MQILRQVYAIFVEFSLRTWLRQHAEEARAKLVNCHPVREEVVRLKNAISKSLDLKDVLSECEWSVTHFRGCLESFQTLVSQHTDVMKVLKGNINIMKLRNEELEQNELNLSWQAGFWYLAMKPE